MAEVVTHGRSFFFSLSFLHSFFSFSSFPLFILFLFPAPIVHDFIFRDGNMLPGSKLTLIYRSYHD